MTDQANPKNPAPFDPASLTPEMIARQSDGYARMLAAADARRVLLDFKPDDVLALSCYALHELAYSRPPEGQDFIPFVAVLIEATKYMVENLEGTRFARPRDRINPLALTNPDGTMRRSEVSDEGLWGEKLMAMWLKYSLLSPGAVVLAIQHMLHHVARGLSLDVKDQFGDNRLGLDRLDVSRDTQQIAQILLENFRAVIDLAEVDFETRLLIEP